MPNRKKLKSKNSNLKNGVIKTGWDLTHLYTSPQDPRLDRDIKIADQKISAFVKKYQNKTDYLKNERKLVQAIEESEKLAGLWKPLYYLSLWSTIHSDDHKAEAKLNQLSQLATKISNKAIFFSLAIGKIPQATQRKFLKSKILAPFRYFLEVAFRNGKYQLSEPEEKILSLKSLPSHGLWIGGVEKQITKLSVKHGGKKIPVSEASQLVPTLPTSKRRVLQQAILDQYKTISDFSESEINAIVINKKINDELRGYKTPYEATVLGYENNPKTVDNLIKTVTSHFAISHRFYKVKAKMLGLKEFRYADRAASVGNNKKKIPFELSLKILQQVFGSLNPHFLKILNTMVKSGRVDVYPRQYKRSGAFCASDKNLPTVILLNHTADMRSTSIFAHEMGHAIHAEYSKKQRILYQDHTIAVAEVASTLFESFVFEEIFKNLPPKEQVIALHDKIQDDVATIFRQIACFNFELELHNQIRAKGSIPKEEIAELLNKHMKSYLGPIMKLAPLDGYFFVTWSHIRNFFYVYSYAHGQIISKALFAKYKQDPKYLGAIETFLSAGGSKSPEDIFKDAGIDITKPDFFKSGLKEIEKDIAKLEKLVNPK